MPLVKLMHLWGGNLSWWLTSIRLAGRQPYGAFSWMLIGVWESSPLQMVQPGGRWTWVIEKKMAERYSQRSKPASSTVLWSLLLFLPPDALSACPWWTETCELKLTLFIPCCFWLSWSSQHRDRRQTRTCLLHCLLLAPLPLSGFTLSRLFICLSLVFLLPEAALMSFSDLSGINLTFSEDNWGQ